MNETILSNSISVSLLPDSPLGPVWVAVTTAGLVALDILAGGEEFLESLKKRGYKEFSRDSEMSLRAALQVGEYLEGKRRSFDLPIDWQVLKPFQRQVLQATYAIPYGHTATYAELAGSVGKPGAARAVGRAQATNPIPLVIPCHRVVGTDGKLHGYGAAQGLVTKAWLLKMEAGSA